MMLSDFTEIKPIRYYTERATNLYVEPLKEGLKFDDYNIFFNNEFFIGHLAYIINKKTGTFKSERQYFVVDSSFSQNRYLFLRFAFNSLLRFKDYRPSCALIERFCFEIDKVEPNIDTETLLDLAFIFAKTLTNGGDFYRFISLFKSIGNTYTLLRQQLFHGHRDFTLRKVNVIYAGDLTDIYKDEILHPEQLLLCVKYSKSIRVYLDFGSFCYIKREVVIAKNTPSESDELHATMVNTSSLSHVRRKVVCELIDLLISSQIRVTSYPSKFRNYKACFDFIDSKYKIDPLVDLITLEEAYSKFIKELQLELADGNIKSSTASNKQNSFLTIIRTIYPNDVGAIEAKYIKIIDRNDLNTEAESITKVRNYYNHILEHALKLHKELHNKNFPPVVRMNSGAIVMYPIHGCVRITSNQMTYGTSSSPVGVIYDNLTGEVRDLKSIIDNDNKSNTSKDLSLKIATRKKQYDHFLNQLNLLQNDKYSSKRYIEITNRLITYYAIILVGLTGANSSDIEGWEYSQALEVIKDPINKELLQVKFRSNGSETKYPIGGNKGLKILKNYMILRNELANISEHDRLFVFILNKSNLTNISKFQDKIPLLDGTSDRTHMALMGDLDMVSIRQLRINKSIILHSLNINNSVVCSLLNHTQRTNLQSYSTNNIDDRVKSFSEFWRAVKSGNERIANVTNPNQEDESLVSGHCKDYGKPIPIKVVTNFKVNCFEEYGCLYCKNFIVHLDELDIHKLLSLRYVIKAIKNYSADYRHAEDAFRFNLLRIEIILNEIRKHEHFSPILDKYIKNVDSLGILTPYWERKLARYEEMGLYI